MKSLSARRIGKRSALVLGVSVVALSASQSVQAQACGDEPVCVIENDGVIGPINAANGGATIVINQGEIGGAVVQGGAVLLHVDNQETGQIGWNVEGTSLLHFSVRNAGEIGGSVLLNDAAGPYVFTGPTIYYIADGGTVDGSVQLGTTGFTTANFIQRGADDGVAGAVSAGAGLDIYTRSYNATQSVALGTNALPTTFEISGYEVLGSGTTLTLTGSGTSISLMGDGNVVNEGTVNLVGTTGLYPEGVVVTPAAISYYQTNSAVYRREQVPAGQPLSFYTIPMGNALTSFTNNGTINGDIILSTATFTNSSAINLSSNGPGTLIRAAADKDFAFHNNGSIVMTNNGERPTGFAHEFEHGVDHAVRIASAVDTTTPKSVLIENSQAGVISGGLAFNGIASDFTFTNAGTISIGDNPNSIDRAVDIEMIEFRIATDENLRQNVVADFATITNTNSGVIDGGIEANFTTRTLNFTNNGHINADTSDPYAAAINLSTDDWADTPTGPDIHDTETVTFLNSATGTIIGSVEMVELNASLVTITNNGSITQGLRPGHGVVVGAIANSEPSETFVIEQETALDAELIFNNTGVISNADYAGGAVFIDLEAGNMESGLPGAATANATVTVTNSGDIIASGGNYLTPGAFGVQGLQNGQTGIDFSTALAVVAEAEGTAHVSITNEANGLIDARGTAHIWTGFIQVGPDSGGIAVAVLADDTVTLVNHGTIHGGPGGNLVLDETTLVPLNMDVDFEGVWGGAIDTFGTSADDITNSATGTIEGGIALRSGDDRFTNLGMVDGSIDMGAGNDWMNAGGTITGNINMGTGNDIFITALNGAASRFGGTIDGGAGLGDSFIFAVNEGGALEEMTGVNRTGFEYVALGGNGTVTSDGTVHGPIQLASGDITLAAGSTFNTSFLGNADLVQTLTNAGTINGNVSLGVQNDIFTNKGTLNGNLDLGDGDDLFVHAWNATLTGTADGGAGTDTFVFDLTGSGTDYVLDLSIHAQLVNFEILEIHGASSGGDIVGSDDDGEINLSGELGSVTLGSGNNTGNLDAHFTGTVDLGEGQNTFTITPGAKLDAGLQAGSGSDTITNQGEIAGGVNLGGGQNEFTNAAGGMITGGVQAGVDGDTITNQGTITGGVDLGDGDNTFTNMAGGTITDGVVAGTGNDQLTNQGLIEGDVYLDGNPGTVAPQAFALMAAPAAVGPATEGNDSFVNEDRITGSVFMGGGDDRLVHSGTIEGAVDMGDGNDTLELKGAWAIGGTADGGTGTDTLNFTFAPASSEAAPALLDLSGFTSFEQLEVAGGVGKIEGSATFEQIDIKGGRLIGAVDSTITANVNVAAGGTFGSAGKVVGNIEVASGGTLSPGASPAVMTVVGDVSLASGSVTTFEFVPAPGQSDQLIIDGNLTIAAGATLNMTGNRPLTPGIAYDMIVADTINGTFTLGTWDHSAIHGFLRYVDGATQDRLQLMGTFVAAADVTLPADLAIDYVNDLLISGQAGAALLDAVPLLLDQNGYASTAAFALVGPEPYATATQIGVDRGLSLGKTFRSGIAHGQTPEARPFTFASGFGNWRTLKADAATGASRAKSDGYGILGGIGYGSDSASIAAFVGYLDTDQKIAALGAKTKVDGVAAGLAGHVATGGFDLSALIAYDWGKADTHRTVPGKAAVSSDYKLRSLILDAKAGYNFALSEGWALRPEVGLTHISTRRSAARETGSAAFALAIDGKRNNATFVDGGITLQGGREAGATFHPWVQLGVRHQLKGDRPWASAGFAGNAARFSAFGADRKDTVITAGAGLRADVSDRFRLFASYQGEFGGGTGSQANIGFELAF